MRNVLYSLAFAFVLLLASLTSVLDGDVPGTPDPPGTIPANTVWLPVVGRQVCEVEAINLRYGGETFFHSGQDAWVVDFFPFTTIHPALPGSGQNHYAMPSALWLLPVVLLIGRK